jgi:putative spermidine/putrescine transport system substrate-binding protein
MQPMRTTIAAALLGMLLAVPPAMATETLTVTVYGGTFEQGWRKSVIEPFEKANPDIKVQIATGLTFENVALMRAQKSDVTVDVLMMDEVASNAAAAEGLFDPLTEATIPNMKDLYPRFRVKGDPYTKFMYVVEVLAYNTDKVKPPPTSYQDMWRPALKDHVGIGDITNTTGIIFFLAVNKMNGGTTGNVDPAFKAIATLKPSIVTYTSQHAQISQLLTSEDIWIHPWVSDRARGLMDTGAPINWVIPKEGSVLIDSTIGIAKGTKHLVAAQKYVNYVLSREAQLANARNTNLNPVNQTVVLPPDLLKRLPAGQNGLAQSWAPDWSDVNKVRPAWNDRWAREITN